MCLILLALSSSDEYPFIVAANRDEFYARPTAAADYWPESPQLLAGRDLRSGGTWLGLTRGGRFAAVTNYRNPGVEVSNPRSRGALVHDYLSARTPAGAYLAQVEAHAGDYQGFNLVCGDLAGLSYYSNRRDAAPAALARGVHAISNHLLNTPWPKVERSTARLRQLIDDRAVDVEALFALLADERPAPAESLPDTGVPAVLEQQLSAVYVRTEHYGTRCSTVLLHDGSDRVQFHERNFIPGEASSTRSFELSLSLAAPAAGAVR